MSIASTSRGLYDAELSEDDSEGETDGCSGSSDSESGSEEEEDESEEEEDEEGEAEELEDPNDVPAAVSSDENGEREACPICLNRFIGQDLGIPESCEHVFCLLCIMEWSQNINTCPIDRNEFNYIHLKATSSGKVLKKIKVKVKPKDPEDAVQEEVTLCEVCRRGDCEDRLLLCDACDLAYHCECLDPPLFRIPIDEWFCPPCSGVMRNGAKAVASTSRSRRVIPRTRASETVRTRVQNRRTGTTTTTHRSPSTSSPKKKAPQKRKRRSYRRSYKKVVKLARTQKNVMDAGKGKSCARGTAVIVTYRKRRYRRRRKTKRKTRKNTSSTTSERVKSAKVRISKHLGLCKPHKGSSIPDVKSKPGTSSTSTASGSRRSHSLFGVRDQLMDFSEDFHEDIAGPSTRTSNYRPAEAATSGSSSSTNILDSILEEQKLLHVKSDNIVIRTDGSLMLKKGESRVKSSAQGTGVAGNSKSVVRLGLSKNGVVSKRTSSSTSSVKGKNPTQYDLSSENKYSKMLHVPRKETGNSNHTSRILENILRSDIKNRNSQSSSYSQPSPSSNSQSEFTSDSSEPKRSRKSLNNSHSHLKRENKLSNFDTSDTTFSSVDGPRVKVDCKPLPELNKSDSGSLKSLRLDVDCKPLSESYKCDPDLFKSGNLVSQMRSCNAGSGATLNFFENVPSTLKSVKQEISDPPNHNKSRCGPEISAVASSSGTAGHSEIKNRRANGHQLPSDSDDTMDFEESESLIQTTASELNTYQITKINGKSGQIKKEIDSTSGCIPLPNSNDNLDSFAHSLESDDESSFQHSQSLLEPIKSEFNVRIKKEVLSDEENPSNGKSSDSRSASNNWVETQSDEDTMEFEPSQSILGSCESTSFLRISGIESCILGSSDARSISVKKEPLSSGEDSNTGDNLKAYPGVIPIDKLVGVQKTALMEAPSIKEEQNSSEDESGGNDLPRVDNVFSVNGTTFPVSLDFDDLPCTQLAAVSREDIYLPPLSTSRITSSFDQAFKLPSDSTANLIALGGAKSINTGNAPIESSELPCTQAVDLPCTQVAQLAGIDTEDLPCTQAAELAYPETDDLPCAQLSSLPYNKAAKSPCLKSKAVHTVQAEEITYTETDDLPCTQIADLPCSQDLELPCTQLAMIPESPPIEPDDLPCTQMAELPNTEKTKLPRKTSSVPVEKVKSPHFVQPQPEQLFKAPFAQPAPKTLSLAGVRKDLSDRGIGSVSHFKPAMEDSFDDLPPTQPVEVFVQSLSKERVSNLDSCSDDLPATQAFHFPVPTSVLASDSAIPGTGNVKIPSNLKSAAQCDTQDMQVSEDHCTSRLPLTESDDLLPTQYAVPLRNGDPVHKSPHQRTSSCDSNINEDLDLPETELVNLGKDKLMKLLKDKISTSKNGTDEKKSPVKFGMHRNLPQVLSSVPAKCLPVPKPSNRKTFSFDQVRQRFGLKDDPKADNLHHRETVLSSLKNKMHPMKRSVSGTSEDKKMLQYLHRSLSECDSLPETQPLHTFLSPMRPCSAVTLLHHGNRVGSHRLNSHDTKSPMVNGSKRVIDKIKKEVLSSDEDQLEATQLYDSNMKLSSKEQEKIRLSKDNDRTSIPNGISVRIKKEPLSDDDVMVVEQDRNETIKMANSSSGLRDNNNLGQLSSLTENGIKMEIEDRCLFRGAEHIKKENSSVKNSVRDKRIVKERCKSGSPRNGEHPIKIEKQSGTDFTTNQTKEPKVYATDIHIKKESGFSSNKNSNKITNSRVRDKHIDNENKHVSKDVRSSKEKSTEKSNKSSHCSKDRRSSYEPDEMISKSNHISKDKPAEMNSSHSSKNRKSSKDRSSEINNKSSQVSKDRSSKDRPPESSKSRHVSKDSRLSHDKPAEMSIRHASKDRSAEIRSSHVSTDIKLSKDKSTESDKTRHVSKNMRLSNDEPAEMSRKSSHASDKSPKVRKVEKCHIEKHEIEKGRDAIKAKNVANRDRESRIIDERGASRDSGKNKESHTKELKMVDSGRLSKKDNYHHKVVKSSTIKNHTESKDSQRSERPKSNDRRDSKEEKGKNRILEGHDKEDKYDDSSKKHKKKEKGRLHENECSVKKNNTSRGDRDSTEKYCVNPDRAKYKHNSFENLISGGTVKSVKGTKRALHDEKSVTDSSMSNSRLYEDKMKQAEKHLKRESDNKRTKSDCDSNLELGQSETADVRYTSKGNGSSGFNKTSDPVFPDQKRKSTDSDHEKKRQRLGSICSDTSDTFSDVSFVEAGENRVPATSDSTCPRKVSKHQRNALDVLNKVADEIIASPHRHKYESVGNGELVKRHDSPLDAQDNKKVGKKQDLKEEIAAEVKIVLKPFYSVGVINKEDYKDIMRRAVPKVFLNCGNSVHPEKIKKLVLSYIAKLKHS